MASPAPLLALIGQLQAQRNAQMMQASGALGAGLAQGGQGVARGLHAMNHRDHQNTLQKSSQDFRQGLADQSDESARKRMLENQRFSSAQQARSEVFRTLLEGQRNAALGGRQELAREHDINMAGMGVKEALAREKLKQQGQSARALYGHVAGGLDRVADGVGAVWDRVMKGDGVSPTAKFHAKRADEAQIEEERRRRQKADAEKRQGRAEFRLKQLTKERERISRGVAKDRDRIPFMASDSEHAIKAVERVRKAEARLLELNAEIEKAVAEFESVSFGDVQAPQQQAPKPLPTEEDVDFDPGID